MIKAKNKDTIVLGLSDENMKRLSQGSPILFNLKELGLPPMDVLIFNGRTEDSMYEAMIELIDIDKTKIQY